MDTNMDTNKKRRPSENPYQTIFDKSMDALLILDSDTQAILKANDTVKTLLGYEKSEVIGKPFTWLFPEGRPRIETPVRMFGSVVETEFRTKDGKVIQMDLTATMIPWPPGTAVLVALRDATDRIRAEEEREKLVHELEAALQKIKTLKGLLPICAHCKKIRDDKGYWRQVEMYVEQHSLAEFTHSICPDCMKKHYPNR